MIIFITIPSILIIFWLCVYMHDMLCVVLCSGTSPFRVEAVRC